MASRSSGVPAWWQLRSELARAQERLELLEGEVAVLEKEQGAFGASPFALERAIREELGLARPGELVVVWPSRFEQGVAGAVASAAGPKPD